MSVSFSYDTPENNIPSILDLEHERAERNLQTVAAATTPIVLDLIRHSGHDPVTVASYEPLDEKHMIRVCFDAETHKLPLDMPVIDPVLLANMEAIRIYSSQTFRSTSRINLRSPPPGSCCIQ